MFAATIHQADDVTVVTDAATAVSVRNRRDSQQDAFSLSSHLCAVADGIGGHAGGAEAAVTALTALSAAVPGPCDVDWLVGAVAAANDAVVALPGDGWRNPGTTLVAVAVDPGGGSVHGVWVGDSRAYLVAADGTVSCLTDDHSEFFGGLSQALGDHGPSVGADPETFTVPVGVGCSVLLCTDGVSGPAERLSGDDVATLAELLPGGLPALVATLAAAGSDNATAVLVDIDRFTSLAAPRTEDQP